MRFRFSFVVSTISFVDHCCDCQNRIEIGNQSELHIAHCTVRGVEFVSGGRILVDRVRLQCEGTLRSDITESRHAADARETINLRDRCVKTYTHTQKMHVVTVRQTANGVQSK